MYRVRLLLLDLFGGWGLCQVGCVYRSQYVRFVVTLEGDGGKDQLESWTMCVDMSNDIP